LWQSPSKEEDHYTFRTVPREHCLIGSVHGTPKLTIQKLRSAGFARPAQFYHNKIVFTHGFIGITLSTAIFITKGVLYQQSSSEARNTSYCKHQGLTTGVYNSKVH